MSEIDPHADVRAGGSADPEEPGPGSGVAGASTQLTGAAQAAANDTLDGLAQFANSAFDVGEAGLQDVLKVVDAAETAISNVTSIITAKITGGEAIALPTIPTADIASTLTADAQAAADRLLNGAQTLVNEAYDFAENELEAALKIVDRARAEVTALHAKIANALTGKIGPAKG